MILPTGENTGREGRATITKSVDLLDGSKK